jgi:excisionase family DNA binding protein
MDGELETLRTLTTHEVSLATGIKRWRVLQLIAEGKGPRHFRVGKTIRVRVKDLESWLEAQTKKTQRAVSSVCAGAAGREGHAGRNALK